MKCKTVKRCSCLCHADSLLNCFKKIEILVNKYVPSLTKLFFAFTSNLTEVYFLMKSGWVRIKADGQESPSNVLSSEVRDGC